MVFLLLLLGFVSTFSRTFGAELGCFFCLSSGDGERESEELSDDPLDDLEELLEVCELEELEAELEVLACF